MAQTNWYAVYVAPRAEKKVSERLTASEIPHYLPLRKEKRRWSDRVKEVELPVINGYLFVKIASPLFSEVVKIYGILNFLRENGVPVVIPDEQMDNFRRFVEQSSEAIEFYNGTFEQGEPVVITKGDLQGLMAEVVNIQGKYRVAIRLDCLGCALTTLPASFIEKIKTQPA